MALTYTPLPDFQQTCVPFSLISVDKNRFTLDSFSSSQVLVVMFICNHCPYVKAVEDRLISLAKKWKPKDVQFVGICSNDWTEHPEDHPDQLLQRWKEKNYSFPYLIDEDQKVAEAFGAVCTPDIFVFGPSPSRNLMYRGRIDDSWKNESQVSREELKEAIEAVLSRQPLRYEPIPSMGCSIKWKSLPSKEKE